jgi:hypothetical protein
MITAADLARAHAAELRADLEQRIGATAKEDHDTWWELDQVISAYLGASNDHADELAERLARHFPSLTMAMLLVWEHVKLEGQEGPCDACGATA